MQVIFTPKIALELVICTPKICRLSSRPKAAATAWQNVHRNQPQCNTPEKHKFLTPFMRGLHLKTEQDTPMRSAAGKAATAVHVLRANAKVQAVGLPELVEGEQREWIEVVTIAASAIRKRGWIPNMEFVLPTDLMDEMGCDIEIGVGVSFAWKSL